MASSGQGPAPYRAACHDASALAAGVKRNSCSSKTSDVLVMANPSRPKSARLLSLDVPILAMKDDGAALRFVWA